jgi:hypothetical protein
LALRLVHSSWLIGLLQLSNARVGASHLVCLQEKFASAVVAIAL